MQESSNMSLGQEILIHPWTKIVTDIFYFDGASYLLIVDYTSRFPALRNLTSTTVQYVAGQMKLVFPEYDWPDTIISDNRPCYSAEAFTKLMKEYSVNHITSSPHYLQSNGLMEKHVQIVKNLFYKVQEEGTDLNKSLMIYRNTHCQTIYSHPCTFCNQELPGHNSLCPMQPETVWIGSRTT